MNQRSISPQDSSKISISDGLARAINAPIDAISAPSATLNPSASTPLLYKILLCELLNVLLQDEDVVYPWNPADAESAPYFSELEANFTLLDSVDSDEVVAQSQLLFERLHQCWDSSSSEKW